MPSELFLSRFAGRTWAAIRVHGRTTELRVETAESARATVGRIVLGRVTRVLPGMQVAFVDIGLERDGFLHVSDLVLPGEEPLRSVPAVAGGGDPDEAVETVAPVGAASPTGPDRDALRRAPIEDRLREGSTLLVQITREPIRSKGARVSASLTFAGRVLVYMPQASLRGVSRRIRDEDERARLRSRVQALDHPGGFIVRTAGEGVDEDAVRDDADRLVAIWNRVAERAARTRAPEVVHDDGDLISRLLRDAPGEGFARIVVDHEPTRERIEEFLRISTPSDPDGATRTVERHHGDRPLFESHALDQDVDRALRPRVWLKSGGTIVIEPTEALVSIDVNTGKYVGKKRPEETVLRTNLEAAVEIARQLRLRDLGGIVVVDFIDMEHADSRRQVLEALEAAVAGDRARTKIVGISDLGLVQMTRKRTRPGLGSLVTRPCPACQGHGRVKDEDTVAWEAMREVHRLLPAHRPEQVRLRAHPGVLRAFAAMWHHETPPIEVERATVHLVEDEGLAPESFDVELRG